MKKKFSLAWNSSKQPRKQRKYLFNLPLHLKSKLLSAHLTKELRAKYGTRSIRVRVGDKVKVMRGQYKGYTGAVESVSVKDSTVIISKVEYTKKDGNKAKYPIKASNIVIEELDLSDKKRFNNIKAEEKKPAKKTTGAKEWNLT